MITIQDIRPKHIKNLNEMMTPEEFHFATVKNNQKIEYEPNQDLLFYGTKDNGKYWTFVFSPHGLVNIINEQNKPCVLTNSEYGVFELYDNAIQITKMFIGFMACTFKEEYLTQEYNRRKVIISELLKAKKQGEKDYANSDIGITFHELACDRLEDDQTSIKEYTKEYLMYMRNQENIIADKEYLDEVNNHLNYQKAILSYLYELGRDVFKINPQDGKPIPAPTIEDFLKDVKTDPHAKEGC